MKGKFQQLQPPKDLIFELNLNKHPKDCKNLSLVDATNIQLSNDYSAIQNVIVEEKGDLYNKLYDIYEGDLTLNKLNCIILGVINCIDELVLFITVKNKSNPLHIYRYKNNILSQQLVKSSNNYFDDELDYIPNFTGEYTYNRNNELIIAFCFYPVEGITTDKQYPLSSVNLGKWIDDKVDVSDLNMNAKTFALNPEHPCVDIKDIEYLNGYSKKGWYNFYLRYKIDRDNYTRWIPLGQAVYLDNFKSKILYENKNKEGDNPSYLLDIISDEYDVCNSTVKLTLDFFREHLYDYKKYQIAFTCSTKLYKECRKTEDIDIPYLNEISKEGEFTLDYKNSEEYDINQLIKSSTNYYNVKNIINYKNQLYISNFEEYDFKLKDLDTSVNINNYELVEQSTDYNINLELFEHSYTSNLKITTRIAIAYGKAYNYVIDKIGKTPVSKAFDWLSNPACYGIYVEQTVSGQFLPKDYKDYLNEDYRIYIEYTKGYGYTEGIILKPSEYEEFYDNIQDIWSCSYWALCKKDDFYIKLIDGQNFRFVDDNSVRTKILIIEDDGEGEVFGVFKRTQYASWNSFADITVTGFGETGEEITEIYIDADVNLGSDTSNIKWCIVPNEYYNFYLHLVNEYGEVSNGKFVGTLFGGQDFNKQYYLKYGVNTLNIKNDRCFLSYEKIDIRTKHKGLQIDNKFYSEELNYANSVDLNVNRAVFKNIVDDVIYKLKDDVREDFKYHLTSSFLIFDPWNSDGEELRDNFTKPNYLVAGSIEDNNKNDNTTLIHEGYKANGMYICYAYNDSLKANKDKIKQLIRCSEYGYASGDSLTYHKVFIYGHLGYGTVLKYTKNYRINQENKVVNKETNEPLTECPIKLYRYPVFSFDFPESKQINNNPQRYATLINEVDYDTPDAIFYDSKLFLVQDSVDLFKNNSLDYQDTILNIYLSEEDVKEHKTIYNKTLRRSDYISDESLVNSWRLFETENYKSIIENKGDIVNLIPVGNILLVHSEHSMFQFNLDDTIIAQNRNIQLSSVDVFNINYKEVFTDKLGTGGISRKSNSILGKFGYIYYSQEDNRYYRYDGGKLITIDDNINLFLDCMDEEYKNTYSKNLTIGYDKRRNIILFNNIARSFIYHLAVSNFIGERETFKNLTYKDTFQYKDLLYNYSIFKDSTILSNNGIDLYYNSKENNEHKVSTFSIIINIDYNKIKVLEYITYKLYKVNLRDKRELNREPYSGYKLRVYNDMCDTGLLDIQNELKQNHAYTEIEKPTYYLGNFNISYLRDKITNSQIFGNYFILRFSFPDDSNIKFEFESLNYSISEK